MLIFALLQLLPMSFTKPKFPLATPSLHTELKKRVQQYFQEKNIKQNGNSHLFWKAGIFIGAFLLVYLHLVLAQPAWYIAIPECMLLGVIVSGIGFNIMHDGGHGSFSKNKTINKLASYSGSLMGASQFLWNIKHNVIHHTYTNVDGHDDDIEIGALMRMAPTQEYYKIHRFQHIYFVALYSIMYLFWVFFSDYRKYFRQRIGEHPITNITTGDHLRFWGVKVLHAIVFILLPMWAVGPVNWLIGFLVMSLTAGFVLSIVFQLAHTVEDTDFPTTAQPSNKLPDEFAVHQIKTTANFATHNKFISWFVGGLNFQIEHHLFPKISHVHYPAISKIVKQVCKEHNLNYIEYNTTRRAIAAHVNFLRRMGKPLAA